MFPILSDIYLDFVIVECAGRRRDEESSNCAGAVCASGGCGRRELEDRRFPTVLTAETVGNIKAQEEERQAQDSKYIDYGHVKAVILSRKRQKTGKCFVKS